MRLFVALNFPASVRSGLWEAAAPLRERSFPVRWVPPDAIHLTVKFLGEAATERVAEVEAGLRRAVTEARALVLRLGGFGVFPSMDTPRIVWAGVDSDPALELLHHDAERALEPLGFPADGRPFRPHVTLGRAARTARSRGFPGLKELLNALEYEATVRIESIELMESLTGASGVSYRVQHRERLL